MPSTLSRRNFLSNASTALAGGLVLTRIPTALAADSSSPAAADATSAAAPAKKFSIPAGILADKGLTPAWRKTLYDRGVPTLYKKSRNELRYIGMPIGGINAGGVYLGGDGRLWLWDIFNDNREGIEPKAVKWSDNFSGRDIHSRDGACYIEPAQDIRPLAQGFSLQFSFRDANGNHKTVVKQLKETDWDEITFEAGYPVANIRYTSKDVPAEVTLCAHASFIPLNEDDSSLPATILSFSVKSSVALTVQITGWLENKVAPVTALEWRGRFGATVVRRKNVVVKEKGFAAVHGTAFTNWTARQKELQQRPDCGSMCIASLNETPLATASVDVENPGNSDDLGKPVSEKEKPPLQPLLGAVSASLELSPNSGEKTADFVISWYFPNLKIHPKIKDSGRFYQNRFKSALDVARYIKDNFSRLTSQTRLFAETWRDSTLPHWFLERTLIPIDTLATSNCHRFSSGRFWSWEGVGACHGTCTHVWQYAHAMGRIFPALERDCRERTDLGIALRPNGGIIFRAEMENHPAIDGQAGSVLRCYREHQMSADDAFLLRNWKNIKLATQFIINQDRNGDGMEDTPLENTLDAVWDGEIAWIVGLCIAAVKAGQRMAEEAGDPAFAQICADYVAKGSANMDKYLFNGEYYIHRPDKVKGRKRLGSYNTSHIDQVMGQSWAYQVGLGEILDNKKVKSALRSLWKYNYTPDVGPYVKIHRGGRPYAIAGDGGLIMNTNPTEETSPYGDNATWQLGYFHECQTGYEYEVAAHWIAEGMTDEGLSLVRVIHDRYHAAKRNPYNEIECSDHYARAMAGYGAFITACGFEYHGPKGYMRFAPKWETKSETGTKYPQESSRMFPAPDFGPASFKAPFTAAEGWGTYEQTRGAVSMESRLTLKYGQLQLKSFSVEVAKRVGLIDRLEAKIGEKKIPVKFQQEGRSVLAVFAKRITIKSGETLSLVLNWRR